MNEPRSRIRLPRRSPSLRLRKGRRGPNPLLIVLGGILAVLFGLGTAGKIAVEQQDKPIGFATAVYGPDNPREVNARYFENGDFEEEELTYNDEGHAQLPEWKPDTPLDVPIWMIPVAPVMGWNTNFFSEVARKTRPLRYCTTPRELYDANNGTQTVAIADRAITAVFYTPFDILPPQKVPCAQADLIMGANSEASYDQGGCNSMDAYGCANVRFNGGRQQVTVTFNGTLRRTNRMADACIEYGIDWHELKHAADLGHTGQYGGEGRNHAHASDLGFIGGNCRPVDNPNSNTPTVQDFVAEGHTLRWGLQLRGAPPPSPSPSNTPSPSPTATPSPSPRPTPSPTPTPQSERLYAQPWVQYSNSSGCASPNIRSGEWCFTPALPIGQQGGVWLAYIRVDSAGQTHYEFKWVDLP